MSPSIVTANALVCRGRYTQLNTARQRAVDVCIYANSLAGM